MSDFISHGLDIDSSGKIKLFQGINAKKDGIQLYIDVNRGEIPFSVFGNSIILYLFHTNNEDEINLLVSDLLASIRLTFGVNIIDYGVVIDHDKVSITLKLEYDAVLQSIISKG